jgi:hypothetical protein
MCFGMWRSLCHATLLRCLKWVSEWLMQLLRLAVAVVAINCGAAVRCCYTYVFGELFRSAPISRLWASSATWDGAVVWQLYCL